MIIMLCEVLFLFMFVFGVQGFSLLPQKDHMLTNMPAEHRDVLTSFYYPDLPHKRGRKVPIGEPVTVLCHLANEGDIVLNITGIMGSLNKYDKFHHYVHNSTFEAIGYVLRPSEEITLTYTFVLPVWVDPSPQYKLCNTVFYREHVVSGVDQYRGLEYSHTFQNSTVELYTNSADLDPETAGMLLLACGFTSLVVYLTYLACSPLDGDGIKRKKGLLNLFRSPQKQHK